MAYVYLHRKADTMEPFYVGISDKNKFRMNAIGKRSKFWKAVYKKHGRVAEKIADNISLEDAKELEVTVIDLLGRVDNGTGILVNLTNGGDGTVGYSHKEETKKLMSENHGKYFGKANHYYGKNHTDEVRAIMKIKAKGRRPTDEARALSIETNKVGVSISKGEITKEFNMVKEAAEFLNLPPTNVSRAAKSSSRKCKGYKVQYIDN